MNTNNFICIYVLAYIQASNGANELILESWHLWFAKSDRNKKEGERFNVNTKMLIRRRFVFNFLIADVLMKTGRTPRFYINNTLCTLVIEGK